MSVDPALAAELAGWNARVKGARESYQQTPIATGANASDMGPSDMVPRARVNELIKANGQLARELREAKESLAKAQRTIALAKMRNRAPR